MPQETRWTYPELVAYEDASNETVAGTGARFCYHVDRTLTLLDDGCLRAECDYCSGWGVARPGAMPDIHPALLKEDPCVSSSS